MSDKGTSNKKESRYMSGAKSSAVTAALIEGFGEKIAERATYALVEAIKPDVRDAMKTAVRELVAKELDVAIRDRVGVVVDDILAQPIPSTNEYGEAKGPKLTMRERVAAQAAKALDDKVDYQGRLETGYSSNAKTRLQWWIDKVSSEVVTDTVAGQIRARAVEVRAELANTIATKALGLVTEALKR